MSRLRARCPDCRTLTAVSLGGDYQCHSCGREFGAGLVRVPRAWEEGGEAVARAAGLPLPWPEAAVVEEGSPEEQAARLAAELPDRPLVLGGCSLAHVGAVHGLAARRGRLAVVWLGRRQDVALQQLLDTGVVVEADVALVEGPGLGTDVDGALAGTAGAYVALDGGAFLPGELAASWPDPHGLAVADADALLERVAARTEVLGAGITGLLPDARNVEPLARLLRGLGL